jgi:hypothetical protein
MENFHADTDMADEVFVISAYFESIVCIREVKYTAKYVNFHTKTHSGLIKPCNYGQICPNICGLKYTDNLHVQTLFPEPNSNHHSWEKYRTERWAHRSLVLTDRLLFSSLSSKHSKPNDLAENRIEYTTVWLDGAEFVLSISNV